MLKKIKNPAVLMAGITFFLIFIYYAFINPVTLWDFDDWRYFGFFESDPIPRLGKWNITRILQEYLMPLAGQFTAFIVYPLVGDYLASAGITLAILMALFLTVLFIVSYRLFCAVCENKNICTMVSLFMIVLCFAIFKNSPDGNIHMFYADTYNLYFCYTLPNILNSIIVLVLMRQMIIDKKLSIFSELSFRTGLLLAGIYFCIFSMLFSAGILFAFAVSIVLYKFFVAFCSKQKLGQRIKIFLTDLATNYNIIIIIILVMGVAMFLELQSGRSNADWDTIYKGSLLSLDFIKRIILAASGFGNYIKLINKYIIIILFLIVVFSVICFFRQKNKWNPVIELIVKSVISLVFLLVFYILVAAKGGIDRIGYIYCIYGVFFFLVLIFSLLVLNILQEMTFSHIVCPFLLTVMIMIVFNSTRWPYVISNTRENADLTNQVIALINEASELKDTEITLYVPESYDLPHWAATRLSHTLYYHNITQRKIRVLDIKCSPEIEEAYYE